MSALILGILFSAWKAVEHHSPQLKTASTKVTSKLPRKDFVETKHPKKSADHFTDEPVSISLSEYKRLIDSSSDPAYRKKMIFRMIAEHNHSHKEEIYDYVKGIEPKSLARTALANIVGYMPSEHINLFYEVFNDSAPGALRSTLINDAIRGMNYGHLKNFLISIENSGFPEDIRNAANDIKHRTIPRGTGLITIQQLVEILKSVKSPELANALVNEITKRELLGESTDSKNYKIPEEFRESYEKSLDSNREHAAQSMTLQQLIDRQMPEELISKKISSLATQNFRNPDVGPERAVSNVAEIPDEYREAYIDSIVDRWLDNDSIGASDYLSQMQPGKNRDQCIAALVRFCLKNNDITSAKQWMSQIDDPDIRKKADDAIHH